MEQALFLNGVYEDNLEEIIKSQEDNPGMVFYLQPYSKHPIKQLKSLLPTPQSSVMLYLSTTRHLNQICYVADIVGWEDKKELSTERLLILNKHINKFQPIEREIYLQVKGNECVNLISIINLRKITNQLSVTNLIKVIDDEPLGERTQAGGWSYVYALPLLDIKKTIIAEQLYKELEKDIAKSLKDDDKTRQKRLLGAPKKPERVQIVSSGFKRNPDVVAEVVKRAKGKCELCKNDAPFRRASDGSSYLEVHHWISLVENGEDTIENAGALCPNCHKEAHFGENRGCINSNKSLPRKE